MSLLYLKSWREEREAVVWCDELLIWLNKNVYFMYVSLKKNVYIHSCTCKSFLGNLFNQKKKLYSYIFLCVLNTHTFQLSQSHIFLIRHENQSPGFPMQTYLKSSKQQVFSPQNAPLCNCPFFFFFFFFWLSEYTTALLLPSWLPSNAISANSRATHLVCGPGTNHTALILITHDQRWVLQQFDYVFEPG